MQKEKFLFIILTLMICFGLSLHPARAETQAAGRENIRSAIQKLLTIFDVYAPPGVQDRIPELQQKLDNLTPEELKVMAEAFDVPRFTRLVDKLKSDYSSSDTQTSEEASSTLEPPNYENPCFPPRVPPAMVLLDYVFVIGGLEEASNVADFLCLAGIFAGEGVVDPSCLAAFFIESVAIVGRTVLALFAMCTDSIDSAQIEAAWKNTVVIHDDLAAHDAAMQQILSSREQDNKHRFDHIEQRLEGVDSKIQKILDFLTAPNGKCPARASGD